MKSQTWSSRYNGYHIVVTSKVSFFPPKTTEILEIDGLLIDSSCNNIFRLSSIIIAKYKFNSIEQEIEIRVGQKAGMSSGKDGCQIFIDDKQISGEQSLQCPNPQIAAKQIKEGFLRYIISVGLPHYGLPITVGLTILDLLSSTNIDIIIKRFLIMICVSSLMGSFYLWQGTNQMLKARLKAQKKLAHKKLVQNY